MKKGLYCKKVLTILILILTIFIKINIVQAKDNINDSEVYINQLEEKNKLFREALDNFGASSIEEAVNLYCEGVEQRSGPLQYSVMCSILKKDFTDKMETDKNYAWVTGVSSPWVTEYKTLDTKKINNDTYLVTVEFTLNDSKGVFGKNKVELELKSHDEKWCISRIHEEDN
ncbi:MULTISPECIES: hypothetical protein [Clostridium]|uniref:DUF4829 domain-containing protein n=3 Tax=Clostridium cadaveris TaxID=1529 RepID=A0A1I2MJA3_9CLOT|nr:hypothetical protein [Clostridium cadaveris]MDU4951888.1 hypothetical protein [Clostridium sp.]MDM8311266.1 hypothetical protein [Clostridium cadaveris]MDY4949613.1 hypothetical protein [Clostridium cadaveris]NME64248.1 hypothetical protein [Clostridium cadaveris]NWK11019.1 hypothetical protein [Clostridium cadaveris]